MEIKGRLVKILQPITGQGKAGEWKKQEFVIELEGSSSFSRKACMSSWGDKVNVDSLIQGSMLNVHFDIESREYQGKWFTNLTAWKVETLEEGQQGQQAPSSPAPLPPVEPFGAEEAPPEKDDLPF